MGVEKLSHLMAMWPDIVDRLLKYGKVESGRPGVRAILREYKDACPVAINEEGIILI